MSTRWKCDGKCDNGRASMEMYPIEEQVGWYQKNAPGYYGGFCRGDRQPAVAVEKLLWFQGCLTRLKIAQQDSLDSFI